MMNTSKAVYLGNTDDKYWGFTVGKKYDVRNYQDDNYISVFGDDGGYRHIKNGEFHKFRIIDVDDFVTENECAVKESRDDKKPELRYYINGYEVDIIEFANVRYTVDKLDDGGVKCDTIKLEVKFQ